MLNNTLGLIFLNGKLSINNNNNNKICNKKTVGEEGRTSEEDHIPIITIILQMFCQQAIYFFKQKTASMLRRRKAVSVVALPQNKNKKVLSIHLNFLIFWFSAHILFTFKAKIASHNIMKHENLIFHPCTIHSLKFLDFTPILHMNHSMFLHTRLYASLFLVNVEEIFASY